MNKLIILLAIGFTSVARQREHGTQQTTTQLLQRNSDSKTEKTTEVSTNKPLGLQTHYNWKQRI